VVDINTGIVTTVTGSAVGFPRPRGHTAAATPDGKFVAFTRLNPASLLIINTATNTLAQNVSLPSNPSSIAITKNAADPNGIFGYVELGTTTIAAIDFNPGSSNFGHLVSGGQVTLTDNIAGGDIAITADGTRVVATSFLPGLAHNVNIVDAAKLRTGVLSFTVPPFFAATAATQITSMALGPIQPTAPANAPAIGLVTPAFAPDSSSIQLQFTGTGFISGQTFFRVGDLDPILGSGTATSMTATVPASAATQLADIVVTNQNATLPLSGQNISGIVRQALQIQPSALFLPVNQVAVTVSGDGGVTILNDATKATSRTAVSPGPIGMAISADGLRAYSLSFRTNVVDVINLDSKLKETSIPLASDTPFLGQVDPIVTAPNILTGNPAEFILTTSANATTGATDLRLVVIDSSPTSATFNTIIRSLQANSPDT